MNVERMSNAKLPLFEIKNGEVFKDDESYYMRTDYETKTNERRCVNVETGECVFFMDEYEVEPIKAKVVIW